jgi:hypothetical protein
MTPVVPFKATPPRSVTPWIARLQETTFAEIQSTVKDWSGFKTTGPWDAFAVMSTVGVVGAHAAEAVAAAELEGAESPAEFEARTVYENDWPGVRPESA